MSQHVTQTVSKFQVGTSGWQYRDWSGVFYPEGMANKKQLAYYAEYFGTVEINSTFYHTPRITTVQKWADETPAGFRITLKLNCYFTHIKKLVVDEESVARLDEFIETVRALGDKLAVVLVQLPPSLRCDLAKLQQFFEAIDGRVTIALECRHESWMTQAVYDTLAAYDALWVINDSPGRWPAADQVIGGVAYVRMHGRDRLYASSYEDDELADMLALLRQYGATSGWIYFNNTDGGAAIDNALAMQRVASDGVS